jgi:hypothetical protein
MEMQNEFSKCERERRQSQNPFHLALGECCVIFFSVPIIFGFICEIELFSQRLSFNWQDIVQAVRETAIDKLHFPAAYTAIALSSLCGWCVLGLLFFLWGISESRKAHLTALMVAIILPFVEYFLLYNPKKPRMLWNMSSLHFLPLTALFMCGMTYFVGRMVRKRLGPTLWSRLMTYLLYGSWGFILVFGMLGIESIREYLSAM